MKKNWIRTAAALVLAAVLLASPSFAVTIGGAKINGSNVRLRTSADTSTNGNIIREMAKGTFLLVEGKQDGWYKVVCDGTEGFVSSDYADFSETLDGTYTFSAATAGTSVNLRSGASTATAVVKNLPAAGVKLSISGVSGEWLKVTDPAGVSGYIRSDLVDYDSDTFVAAAASTAGEKIVQTAQLYLGYPYRWGGMSPSTGFDCSGFANYVCKENGYSLHRTAQDVYSNDGTSVSKENLQPGDLLFFGYGSYSVTHMGIYVGNGQMIHASTSTTGVIYSDINSSYYTRMYVGAKRIV